MTSLSDLFSQLKSSNFIQSVKDAAAFVGLLPDDWVEGDHELSIVEAVGDTVELWWNTWVWYAIRGGFLDYAEGFWLTLLARNVFFVDRILATLATGAWTGTNATGGNIGPFNPDDLVFVCLDTGKTYRNSGVVTFTPGVNAPIAIVAVELGSGSNAAPTRVVLQTTVLGLSGTNAIAITARDDEPDPALRARCRLKVASLSPNGPGAAYEYVCLTPSFHGVTVNRVKVSKSSLTGTVDILIANPGGPVSSSLPDDVGAVDAAVHANVTPDSVTSTVTSATGHSIAVTWQGWAKAKSGIDPTAALANARAALTLAFSEFPIGGDEITPGSGYVYVNILESIIRAAIPELFQVVVTAPATNEAIGASEVPVLGVPTGVVTVVA